MPWLPWQVRSGKVHFALGHLFISGILATNDNLSEVWLPSCLSYLQYCSAVLILTTKTPQVKGHSLQQDCHASQVRPKFRDPQATHASDQLATNLRIPTTLSG